MNQLSIARIHQFVNSSINNKENLYCHEENASVVTISCVC